MGVLLILVGLLAAASGGMKIRGRVRQMLGFSRLAIGETAAGAGAIAGAAMGLSGIRPLAWFVVVFALGLTLISTWVHSRRVADYVKRREASEALRLKAYLHSREFSE